MITCMGTLLERASLLLLPKRLSLANMDEEVPSKPRREGEEDNRGEEGADCLHSNMGSSNFEDGCMDETQLNKASLKRQGACMTHRSSGRSLWGLRAGMMVRLVETDDSGCALTGTR